IEELRLRQRLNFLMTMCVSRGVPMLSGGEELGRSQQGNNNGYCQDSTLSWHDWKLPETERRFVDFVSRLVDRHAAQPVLRGRTFLAGRRPGTTDVVWLRADGLEMANGDWADTSRRPFGMLLDGQNILERDARGEPVTGDTLLVFFKHSAEAHTVTMPPWRAGARWTRLIDTAEPDAAGDTLPPGGSWSMTAHSAVVWVERPS